MRVPRILVLGPGGVYYSAENEVASGTGLYLVLRRKVGAQVFPRQARTVRDLDTNGEC